MRPGLSRSLSRRSSSAHEMSTEMFTKHIRARHPELDEEKRAYLLKDHHHQARECDSAAFFDHIREPASDPIVVRKYEDRLV